MLTFACCPYLNAERSRAAITGRAQWQLWIIIIITPRKSLILQLLSCVRNTRSAALSQQRPVCGAPAGVRCSAWSGAGLRSLLALLGFDARTRSGWRRRKGHCARWVSFHAESNWILKFCWAIRRLVFSGKKNKALLPGMGKGGGHKVCKELGPCAISQAAGSGVWQSIF